MVYEVTNNSNSDDCEKCKYKQKFAKHLSGVSGTRTVKSLKDKATLVKNAYFGQPERTTHIMDCLPDP